MAQFIGKTITLISNSENRYVGILHEINAQDSTVSLRHVRSYGSEGRRNGINEFPPSDRVFEYIVFRGSDVKDLKISEMHLTRVAAGGRAAGEVVGGFVAVVAG